MKASQATWAILDDHLSQDSQPKLSRQLYTRYKTIDNDIWLTFVFRMTYLVQSPERWRISNESLVGLRVRVTRLTRFHRIHKKPGVTKCVHFNVSAIENATGRPIWRPSICSRTEILSLFLLLTTTTIILFWKQTVLVHLPIPFCQETMVSGRSTETVNLINCCRIDNGKMGRKSFAFVVCFYFLCCFVLWAQHLENYDELQS